MAVRVTVSESELRSGSELRVCGGKVETSRLYSANASLCASAPPVRVDGGLVDRPERVLGCSVSSCRF